MSTNLFEIITGGLVTLAAAVIISSIKGYIKKREMHDERQNDTNNALLTALQDLGKQLEVAITKINERDINQKEICLLHNRETAIIKRELGVAVSKLNVKIDNNEHRIIILEEHIK